MKKNKKEDIQELPEEPKKVLEVSEFVEPEKNEDKPRITKIKEFLLFNYDFRFNKTTYKLEFKTKTEEKFKEFEDKHKADVILELKTCKFRSPKEDIDDILKSSLIEEFNPIAEYFDNLEFKGFGYIKKLSDCVILDNLSININGKDYRTLFEDYFKRWLMACYFCSTLKSINDVMFILIGAQGKFKTSFLNYLCPKELVEYRVCSHINPSLTDYNTANYLSEKFLINIDDQMETIFGKDYNSMKAIISAPDISMRKLYRSDHKRRRRIGNFCGSVNESRFLRDSNNRRYLCFKILDILPKYSTIDISSLWAEIKHEADKLNSLYIFTKEDYGVIDTMNEMFECPNEETETLNAIFKPALDEQKQIYYMSFSEILYILKLYTNNNMLKPYNLQTAMRKMKFESKPIKTKRFQNSSRYLYPVQLITDKQGIIDRCNEYREHSTFQIEENETDIREEYKQEELPF